MNSKRVGDIAVAAFITKFLQYGWHIATPFGDNTRYDLILDRGKGLERIQVKSSTYYPDKGIISVHTRRLYNSATTNNTVYCSPYTKEEIDLFAIYSPEFNKFFLVPISIHSKKSLSLRVTQTTKNNNSKRVKWAKDFEI